VSFIGFGLTFHLEKQSVVATWRVLTRKHAQKYLRNLELDKMISESMTNVLLCAGVREARHDITPKLREAAEGAVNQAVHLNRVIGQGVVSSNMLPLYPIPDSTFEVDTNGSGTTKEDMVFCTTRLGLRKVVKTDDGNWEGSAILKPAVILVSELPDILSAD
jgi:hypothetical protein